MSESGESEGEGEVAGVRSHLVYRDGRTDPLYRVGRVACAVASDTSSVICIAELGGRVIAAVPRVSWHKKVEKRKLNKNFLGKVVAVDVAGCYLSDPETPVPELVIKVWVGVMSMEFEAACVFEEGSTETLTFGEGAIPYAEALVRLADEQFAFTTAESGGGGEGMFRRMAAVETSIGELTLGATAREREKTAAKPAEQSAPQASAKQVRGAKPKGAPKAKASPLDQMDRGTVAAARAAGVPEDALTEMAWMMTAKKTRAGEPTCSGFGELLEDDFAGEPELIEEPIVTERGERNQTVEQAVLQLTQIVTNLTQKKPQDLDSVLDQGGLTSSGEGGGLGTGRKSAAALRYLTRVLEEQPHLIYESVEWEMRKDLGMLCQSSGDLPFSARNWLCSRSRVTNIQSHVRWCWQVGGILDELIAGNSDRARAKACLLLAAADQCSIDAGSWVMSTVSLLEPVPPYQEFAKHSSPSASESQVSALYDARWAEVFLGSLRDRESFNEARRKLSHAEKQQRTPHVPPGPPGDGKDTPKPSKGGGRGRGGKGGDGSGTELWGFA